MHLNVVHSGMFYVNMGKLIRKITVKGFRWFGRLETAQTVKMCLYSANTSYLQEIIEMIISNSTLTLSNCYSFSFHSGIREEKMYISII